MFSVMRFQHRLFLLAVVILVLVSGGRVAAEGLRLGLMATTDTTPIKVRVDGHLFVIPRNYFLHPPRRDGAEDDGFLLQVLLPDLEPYTAENAEKFRRGGFGRTMSILLEGGQKVRPLGELFNHYLQGNPPSPPSEVTFGLAHGKEKRSGDIFAFVQEGQVESLFMCWLETPDKETDCQHSFMWMKFDVKLTYSRTYLKDWHTIQNNVETLLSRRLKS